MDSLYLILLALFLLVIIPRIMQRRRLAAIRHILNRKMRNKENIEMKELAKRFIGEECIIYTITSNDGSVQGLIKEIDDGGMVIEKKTGELEIVNLLAQGITPANIAHILHITVPTTNRHIYNIYKKLNVNSRAELMAKIK